MIQIETNIYMIQNLGELNCKYRIYRLRGLSPDSEDYHRNLQFLESKLTYQTGSPCVTYTTENGTFIAQPDGYEELPGALNLVRVPVKIEKEPEIKELKFNSLDTITAKLAARFLYEEIQRKFYESPWLWQPSSGFPFYHKSPDQEFRKLSDNVDLYRGFTFRVVLLPNGKIGICVDVSSKYVSRNPLPTKISRDGFRKYQGMKCLYEYGNRWYEVRIENLNDLNAGELILPNGISLFDDVHNRAGSHKSQNLLTLPKDCSVLIYYNSWREPRNIPSGLCRMTFGTGHPEIKRFHSKTIKQPYLRRNEIQFVVNKNFRELTFGSSKIQLSDKPLIVENKRFTAPDLEFGKDKILSLRNSPNAINVSLDEFPSKKKDLLYSPEAGLFTKKPFDRQYLILPKSVCESFGEKFINDVKSEVQRLCSPNDGIVYSPITIPYNDSVQKSIYRIGKEIIKAVEECGATSGYGLVMIPELKSSRIQKEDELANLVMRELRQRDIYVSVIHTTVPTESYESIPTDRGNGGWSLVFDKKQQGKYRGYLKNVVLNKILILNSFWPFVLKTPLHTDLVIGIDVKNNTAGFTIIHKNGAYITFHPSESDQKEQLGKNHIRTKITEIIRKEQGLSFRNIKDVVIYRQGKLFPTEKEGILQALNSLSKEKLIDQDYRCTFVDIRTTSRVPFRLFSVSTSPGNQREWVDNPTIGTYNSISDSEAFICNTGIPYGHRGTTKPIHIIKDGPLPIEFILEDEFYLSNLTWTKVDDCSRQPLFVKINDIRLREFAGEYDRDALNFVEEE